MVQRIEFIRQILKVINSDEDFNRFATGYFGEQEENIKTGTQIVINVIIKSLATHIQDDDKANEIHHMAREARSIYLNGRLAGYFTNTQLMVKGGGYISELFGRNFNELVGQAAVVSSLKAGTVNKLFVLLTPVTLSVLNRIFHLENNEGSSGFDMFLYSVAFKISLPEALVPFFPEDTLRTPKRLKKQKFFQRILVFFNT